MVVDAKIVGCELQEDQDLHFMKRTSRRTSSFKMVKICQRRNRQVFQLLQLLCHTIGQREAGIGWENLVG
eukprot:3913790-Rhodomonas_salina.2